MLWDLLKLPHKVGACGGFRLGRLNARRAGTTSALEALEKVPQFYEMPLISSTYWPMVHGGKAEDVPGDAEGMQIMRNLGHNMAWMLRCIEAGRAAGIEPPQAETAARTNFVR